MNRFITETEVEEAKKKRAEEWEAARAAGRDVPDIDEPVDTRSLYERLKEQKDKKQEAFEDQLKFKNMIYKGLNEEDADFLGMVAKKKAELDDKRFDEESEEIRQYRSAVEESSITRTKSEENGIDKKMISDDFKKKSKKNQQAALLAASIKKKRKSEPEEKAVLPKKLREDNQSNESQEKSVMKPGQHKDAKDSSVKAEKTNSRPPNSLATLADYPSSSEED